MTSERRFTAGVPFCERPPSAVQSRRVFSVSLIGWLVAALADATESWCALKTGLQRRCLRGSIVVHRGCKLQMIIINIMIAGHLRPNQDCTLKQNRCHYAHVCQSLKFQIVRGWLSRAASYRGTEVTECLAETQRLLHTNGQGYRLISRSEVLFWNRP